MEHPATEANQTRMEHPATEANQTRMEHPATEANQTRMEHPATEANQTPQVGDQSQAAQNSDHKSELKHRDAKKLIKFMENKFEEHVADVQSFEDFYHAIFELIEMFCEERGQLQYRIPAKEKLREAYNKHHTTGGDLKREEFMKISKEVIGRDSFAIGKATGDLLMLLFGAPLCALVAKRILPGLGWLSDDVVIPLATSGSVVYLLHSKKI